jgi:hypothetical protein
MEGGTGLEGAQCKAAEEGTRDTGTGAAPKYGWTANISVSVISSKLRQSDNDIFFCCWWRT